MLKTIILLIQIILIAVYIAINIQIKKYIKAHSDETLEKCGDYLSKKITVRNVLTLLVALCAISLIFIR